MQEQNTSDYVCSLASRLNTSGSLQKTGGGSSSTSVASSAGTDEGSQPECNLCQAGSCGIEAIASSPSETYNFYAKTAPRDDDSGMCLASYNEYTNTRPCVRHALIVIFLL